MFVQALCKMLRYQFLFALLLLSFFASSVTFSSSSYAHAALLSNEKLPTNISVSYEVEDNITLNWANGQDNQQVIAPNGIVAFDASTTSGEVCYTAFYNNAWQPQVCQGNQIGDGINVFQAIRILAAPHYNGTSVCYETLDIQFTLYSGCDGTIAGSTVSGLGLATLQVLIQ